MIDTKVIEMLDSPQVSVRKQAVKSLARSGDREALTYLADVYRNDEDDEVRELARKAGVYIRKNVPEAPVVEDRLGDIGGYGGSLYDDDEDDYAADMPAEPDVPLPSDIHVTASQKERAQGYIDQAMDLNIRGDNAKAAEAMSKAIKLNPQLIYDKYVLSLASTVTGLDGETAMQRLSPSADELRKRAAKGGRGGAGADVSNPAQSVLAGLMMICAAVALVGYFIFPWVDVGAVEDPSTGTTLNEGIEAARGLIPFFAGSGLEGEATAVGLRALIDNVELSPSGFATTQYSSGMSNVLEYFGIIDAISAAVRAFAEQDGASSSEINEFNDLFIEQIESELGDSLSIEAEPLDFTLWLVPVVAIFAGVFGIVLLQGTSISKWSIAIVLGLIGVVPMLYFYANGIDSLFERTLTLGETALVDAGGLGAVDDFGFGDLGSIPGGTDLAGSGDDLQALVNQFDGNDLLGMGFWMSLFSILGITLLPFIGMLLLPEDG